MDDGLTYKGEILSLFASLSFITYECLSLQCTLRSFNLKGRLLTNVFEL